MVKFTELAMERLAEFDKVMVYRSKMLRREEV